MNNQENYVCLEIKAMEQWISAKQVTTASCSLLGDDNDTCIDNDGEDAGIDSKTSQVFWNLFFS